MFLQVLLNKKTIGIVKKKLDYSAKQKERIKELIIQEHKTKYYLYKIESQLTMDSLAFIKATNEYKISVLQLKQFLSLKSETKFILDTILEQKPVEPIFFSVNTNSQLKLL